MSVLVDDLIVCPKEAVPDGVESSLSVNGLEIVGADFGETKAKGTAVQTDKGITLVNREPETRTVTLKLRVRPDSTTTLPQAADYLQTIVGVLQSRDEWFRRDHHVGGNFGSMLYHVTGEVSLADFAGWQAGDSPDVTLSMVCDFAAYSTEEREEGPFESAVGARHLTFTEQASVGSTKGLWRGHITNEGEENWRGLILSRECRYAPDDLEDPTAAPHYLAKNLTLRGGSEVKTVSGAEVVEYAELPASWLTILSSEIPGIGHMTHKGPRPMCMRIYDPGATAGGVQLRLQARVRGSSRWDESLPIVSTPLVKGWVLVTLGTARPDEAVLGDNAWEWRLQSRAPGGSGSIRIRDVYPLSSEQMEILTEPPASGGADVVITKKAAGTIVGNSAELGGTIDWATASNAKSSDNAYATATRTAVGYELSKGLKLTNWGFAIPSTATILGVGMDFEVKAGGPNPYITEQVNFVVAGAVYDPHGANPPGPAEYWGTSDEHRIFGGSSYLPGLSLTPAQVNAEGFGVFFQTLHIGAGSVAYVDSVSISVYYTESEDDSPVCFAGRSLELRSNGVYRQHASDDVWGRLVADGFPPYVPAGGLEGKQCRTIIIPSAGDFETLPDGAAPSLATSTYSRDGHHFAREAL